MRTDRTTPTLTIPLTGELDIATAPDTVRDVLLRSPGHDIHLDLTDLTFLDVRGVGALLALQQKLHGRDARLTLGSPSGLVRDVIAVIDVRQLLRVLP